MASHLFNLRTIPGKGGVGLIAIVNIQKGTRIVAENPLVTSCMKVEVQQLQADLKTQLESGKLPESVWDYFPSLADASPGDFRLADVMSRYSLDHSQLDGTGGIYESISRINHSCQPNDYFSWHREDEVQTIHAVRNILVGEEITISYSPDPTVEKRRAVLKNSFGFECTCSGCTFPSDVERRMSDDTRTEITTLSINRPDRQNDPKAALKAYRSGI